LFDFGAAPDQDSDSGILNEVLRLRDGGNFDELCGISGPGAGLRSPSDPLLKFCKRARKLKRQTVKRVGSMIMGHHVFNVTTCYMYLGRVISAHNTVGGIKR